MRITNLGLVAPMVEDRALELRLLVVLTRRPATVGTRARGLHSNSWLPDGCVFLLGVGI